MEKSSLPPVGLESPPRFLLSGTPGFESQAPLNLSDGYANLMPEVVSILDCRCAYGGTLSPQIFVLVLHPPHVPPDALLAGPVSKRTLPGGLSEALCTCLPRPLHPRRRAKSNLTLRFGPDLPFHYFLLSILDLSNGAQQFSRAQSK